MWKHLENVGLEAREFPAANSSTEAAIGDLENAAELIAAAFEDAIENLRTSVA